MKQMDAILIFPPPMDRIDRVYSAPHFLSSFLNSRGFSTKILDLNLEALLCLAKSYSPDSRDNPPGYILSRLNSVQDLMAMEISEIRYTQVFRHRFKNMFGRLYQTPTLSCKTIQQLSVSPEIERLMGFLHDTLVQKIVGTRAALVGFSIPFSQQLVPAVALARKIKQMATGVHICFGGPVITLMSREDLAKMHAQLPVDSFVQYEGERPLARLIKAVKTGRLPEESDGLLTFEPHQKKTVGRHAPANQLPTPVYDYNRFGSKALAQMPRAVKIPIRQSAGCYWKKCTFCDYVNLHRDKTYRPRKTAEIISDIRYYTDAGFLNFRMLAEAIPPAHAMKIAEAILEQGLKITWHAFIRVDTGFTPKILKTLKKSGFNCTVGMESASSRILALLNKGYDRTGLQDFVNNMKLAAFYNNHVNIMVGVPGETWEDSLETLGFCMNCNGVFNWFKPSRFTLTATSHMGKHPEKYGIRVRETTGKQGSDKTGGRLTAKGFDDPDGMSEAAISALFNAYAKLNKAKNLKQGFATGHDPHLPALILQGYGQVKTGTVNKMVS